MRVYKAAPTKTASFAPGRDYIIMSVPGHPSHRAEVGEFMRFDYLENAPVEKLDTQFIETMKTKGWLKK